MFFMEDPSYEELKPFLVLRTGRGELHLSLLKRLNRDNIDTSLKTLAKRNSW